MENPDRRAPAAAASGGLRDADMECVESFSTIPQPSYTQTVTRSLRITTPATQPKKRYEYPESNTETRSDFPAPEGQSLPSRRGPRPETKPRIGEAVGIFLQENPYLTDSRCVPRWIYLIGLEIKRGSHFSTADLERDSRD